MLRVQYIAVEDPLQPEDLQSRLIITSDDPAKLRQFAKLVAETNALEAPLVEKTTPGLAKLNAKPPALDILVAKKLFASRELKKNFGVEPDKKHAGYSIHETLVQLINLANTLNMVLDFPKDFMTNLSEGYVLKEERAQIVFNHASPDLKSFSDNIKNYNEMWKNGTELENMEQFGEFEDANKIEDVLKKYNDHKKAKIVPADTKTAVTRSTHFIELKEKQQTNPLGRELFLAVRDNDLPKLKKLIETHKPNLETLTDHCDYRLEYELKGSFHKNLGAYEDNTLINLALTLEHVEVAAYLLELHKNNRKIGLDRPNQPYEKKSEIHFYPLEMAFRVTLNTERPFAVDPTTLTPDQQKAREKIAKDNLFYLWEKCPEQRARALGNFYHLNPTVAVAFLRAYESGRIPTVKGIDALQLFKGYTTNNRPDFVKQFTELLKQPLAKETEAKTSHTVVKKATTSSAPANLAQDVMNDAFAKIYGTKHTERAKTAALTAITDAKQSLTNLPDDLRILVITTRKILETTLEARSQPTEAPTQLAQDVMKDAFAKISGTKHTDRAKNAAVTAITDAKQSLTNLPDDLRILVTTTRKILEKSTPQAQPKLADIKNKGVVKTSSATTHSGTFSKNKIIPKKELTEEETKLNDEVKFQYEKFNDVIKKATKEINESGEEQKNIILALKLLTTTEELAKNYPSEKLYKILFSARKDLNFIRERLENIQKVLYPDRKSINSKTLGKR